MRRRTKIAGAVGITLALGISAPASASWGGGRAQTLVVNTTADTTDVRPGDGRCADSSGKCSLRAAVQEANTQRGETTIRLRRSTYALTVTGAGTADAASGDLDVSSDIRIDGRGATVELSALGDRAFDVVAGARLRADGLRVQNGAPPATESGGAFRSSGDLRLTAVTATGNTVKGAGASGGAVVNLGGDLSVSWSTLSGNSAARAGGAIEAAEGRTSVVLSTLSDNETGPTPGNGGALHLTGAGDVRVHLSRITDNVAAAEGGGLWNSATGTMTVGLSSVTGNVANGIDADQGGGGLFNDGGTLKVFGTTVAGNSAPMGSGSGGGILNNLGLLDVDAGAIYGNSAARAGGGIETVGGTVELDGVALWVNQTGPTPGNGGGLHVSGAGTVDVRRSTVVRNTAANEGGGLWNSAVGTMTVDRSSIVGNTANGDLADEGGGGLFNQSNPDGTSGGTLTVTRSTISDNTAPVGSGSGGGILNERGTVAVSDSTITRNQSARAGGGIEAVGGDGARVGVTRLDDVRLTDNRTGASPGNGGGLHLSANGEVVIDDSRVTGNDAANEGGGLWNSPVGQMTVTDSSITRNTVGVPGNGPNVFQKGPLAGGVFTVDGTVIPEGPNTLDLP